MNGSILLAHKDLVVFFRSPLAYIVLFCFLLISGYFFTMSVGYYAAVSIQVSQNPGITDFNPNDVLIGPLLQNSGVILLFFLPLLTMRSFSEEKKSGAFELLMSYPLREWDLVAGKLLALAAFLAVAVGLHAVSPLMLMSMVEVEPLPVLTGYLGFFLLALSFASLGVFFSTLTENQIVAAVFSFASLLLLWLFSWIKDLAPQSYGAVFAALSPMSHLDGFAKGVLNVADLTYYLTFLAGFFWLSVLSLENQRWRR
jgi:ABC-2 type transport system permease protein